MNKSPKFSIDIAVKGDDGGFGHMGVTNEHPVNISTTKCVEIAFAKHGMNEIHFCVVRSVLLTQLFDEGSFLWIQKLLLLRKVTFPIIV